MIEGDWRAAALEWERIGCPFERALALALAEGNEEAQLSALSIYDELGAQPAAKALRQTMRRQGIKGIPRGPRPVTRANPEGLTAREMQVLELMVEGLSNADIARRLSVSAKTVDHHVSSVLSKLNVHTRQQAASLARKRNILL
jgi:DNA-binding NarL/FixJ family response regulator